GHGGVGLTERVEVAPHDREAHDFCLASACSDFERVARPEVFLRTDTERRYLSIWTTKFCGQPGESANLANLIKVDKGLDSFSLAEVITERCGLTAVTSELVVPPEPMMEQFDGGV